ncbi:uncharacterized protein LOC113360383 [Papaver somniferum]|uniref:uncharacterized protein LOC113360383 n=1 Tax=Papaver somniferum TaxID=3469 RepID=UPI000E6FF8B7|nr:uncharacterized protein LOC113360383 [Papaver somniferum]
MVHDCEVGLKGNMNNFAYDLQILKYSNIGCRKVKSFRALECTFSLPASDRILLCCDGASQGNPGCAGYGFIARDSEGKFIFAESVRLGISTKFIAEVLGIIGALEWAVLNSKDKVNINSDSTTAITAFIKTKLPWFVWTRWLFICRKLRSIHFNHVYRETNFSADFFANKCVYLMKGQEMKFSNRPSNMHRMEMPDKIYYTF